MNLSARLVDFQPMLAATRIPVETLVMLGASAVLVITMFTFSNWRAGVKIAFVMVLFEGAIRKWLIPSAQELAYFAKDMFLIGAYFRFFFSPDMDIRAWRLKVPAGLILLCCALLSFSALNPNIGSILLGLYGIKIYVFYIPLIFMVPYLFKSREDLMNHLFWYAMLATPICLLGVAQFAAPGYSALNVMATGDQGITMGWSDASIRVTGTFSFITGHTTFVCVFFALHLALLLNKMPKWRWVLLASNLPLIVANAFMSGSRSSIFALVLIGVAFLAASSLSKLGTGGNGFLMLGGVASVAVVIVLLFFGHAREQWMMRWRSSDAEVQYRLIHMTTGSISEGIKAGGFFGLGIGMTHPAVERLRNVLQLQRPKTYAPVFDTEVGQVVVELGIIGWGAWYVMRIALVIQAWTAFNRSRHDELKPVLLACFLVEGIHMYFSVVLNHTANFLFFACSGITLIPTLHPAIKRAVAAGGQALPPPDAGRGSPIAGGRAPSHGRPTLGPATRMR